MLILTSARLAISAAMHRIGSAASALPSDYHPELHYMRGRGPAWCAKNGVVWDGKLKTSGKKPAECGEMSFG